jgi:hypothetical protein
MTFCRNEQHYGSGERSVENADALEGPSVVVSKESAYIVLLAKRREKVNHINNQFREEFSCCDATLSRPSAAHRLPASWKVALPQHTENRRPN